ncbi:Bax inhibitor-1/YccA family protein [Leyella stercorea]
MKEPKWWLDTESLQGGDFAMSTAFSALMRKVFIWMALALVITGVTAYGVATTPSLLIAIVTNKAIFWGLIIAELALVFAVSGAINRLSLATATLLFVLYSVVNGATLSVIFLAYSMPAIIQTFFITAGTFGVMALVGYTTKTDLTSLGKLLFMALIGLVIATVVNMFVGSTGFDYILSYVGVLIFVGLTAYDTQKIKQMCMQAPDAGEHMQKLALLGALSLYLDFINLFLYLLRIFGNNKD